MKLGEIFKVAEADKKKLGVLLLCSVVAILLLIFSHSLGKEDKANAEPEVARDAPAPLSDKSAELERVLAKIVGVGKVAVVIDYEDSGEKAYAYNEESSERNSGAEGDINSEISRRREIVLLRGDEEPLVLSSTAPKIGGVIVVAEGAGQAKIREQILAAVTTYLHIGANRVNIAAMEV